MVNCKVTKDEHLKITEIAKRAVEKFRDLDFLTIQMDITAAHANGNQLRLEDLLKADDFNFFHDVIGIYNNINRETGKLENCFFPRFSNT